MIETRFIITILKPMLLISVILDLDTTGVKTPRVILENDQNNESKSLEVRLTSAGENRRLDFGNVLLRS